MEDSPTSLSKTDLLDNHFFERRSPELEKVKPELFDPDTSLSKTDLLDNHFFERRSPELEKVKPELFDPDTSLSKTEYLDKHGLDVNLETLETPTVFGEEPKEPSEEDSVFTVSAATDEPTLNITPDSVNRNATMFAVGDLEPFRTDTQDMFMILRERRAIYEDRIKAIGDSDIRREKAHQKRTQEVRDMVALSRDMANNEDFETSEGAALLAEQAAFQDMEVAKRYAAEQETAQRIAEIALNDPTQARMIQESMESESVTAFKQDRLTGDLILQSAIDSTEADDRHLLRKSFDVALNILNFVDGGVSSVSIIEDKSFWEKAKNVIASGKQTEEDAFVWHSMSAAEKAEAIPAIQARAKEASTLLGMRDRGEEANLLRYLGNTPSRDMKNTFDILEIVSFVPVTKLATVSKSLIKGGARSSAVDVTAAVRRQGDIGSLETAAREVGMTAEEVIENSLPTALKHDRDGIVSIAADSDEIYTQNRLMYDDLMDLNASTRLTDGEKALQLEKLGTKYSTLANRPVKDVEISSEVLADGSSIDTVVATLGKKDQGGFASKKSAERLGSRHSLAGESYQDASGQWFYKAVLPVREGDFYVSPLKTSVGILNPFWKYVRGSSQQGDAFIDGLAQQAGRMSDKVHGVTMKIYDKNLSKIGKKDSQTMAAILIKNTDDEAWMSPQEFKRAWETKTGKPPHPIVQQGYQDYQKLMDLEYVLRNDIIYKQHALQGLETVDIPMFNAKGNAKVTRELPDKFPERSYNLSDDVHYVGEETADAATLARLKNEGYIQVSLQEGVKLPDGTIIKSFIGKPKEFNISPLARVQLGYKAGPHRIVTDNYFAKAASRHTQPDTGTVVLNSPKTYRTFSSQKEAQEWVDVMNEAGKVSDDIVALEKVFDGRPEFPTPAKYMDEVKNGRIDPKETMEALYDQTMPDAYNPKFNYARMFEGEFDEPIESLGRTQGRMYYSGRGDRLDGGKDVYGAGKAPVLDPFMSLHKSLGNASRSAAFSDYQLSQANRFMRTFEKHVDPDSVGPLASPQAFVRNAKLREDVIKNKPKLAQEFDVQQRINGRIMNAPTAFDQQMLNANRGIEESFWVKVAGWQRDTNPFNALRGMAFDLKLGLFNVAQFPLQVSTSIQAAMLSKTSATSLGGKVLELPKVAFQNYTAGILMRFAHEYGPKSAAILENKALLKSLGFSNKREAEEMFSAFRESGWMEVGNSHILINDSPTAMVKTGLGRSVEKARTGSRVFFYEAEKWNRAVAFSVAWREAKIMGKNMSRKDGSTMNQVMKKANDYSFQMTAESRSAYQKGIASIPTQFFSYPLRMVEMMTGKTLSNSQKARLIVGQTALYGSSGTLLVGGVDYLKNKTGTTPKAGTPLWMVDRGLLDSLIHFTTGADVAMGQRIGTGNFLPDVINQLMDNSPYGDVGPLDVLGGAPVQIGGDVLSDFADVIKYSYATQGKLGDPLTKKAVLDLMKNVSSFSNASKASVAWKYGMLYSNSGTFVSDDIIKPEAVFLALGIQPADMNDIGVAMSYLSDAKTQVKDTADIIKKLKTQWVNTPGRREEIAAQINSLQHMTDSQVWSEAMDLAEKFKGNDALNKSVADSLRKKQAKDKMQQRIKERNESNN